MRAPLALALGLVVVGCGEPAPLDAGADAGGMDAAAIDAGAEDAGLVDAGLDDAGLVDAGPQDASVWVGPGCDPVHGIECDGDWTGRCDPACAATECCSPQYGEFTCVARDADGACPAADIWFDASRITGRYDFGWREFESADCAIAESCVDGTGWRRLLRFATWTPNTGTADLYLGNPAEMPELFTFSPCHDHFHFDTYARFELRDLDGAVVAPGHKQATCLLDTVTYPDADIRGALYTCDNQGIQRGWQDVYYETLDCQWVDVTDVPPGDYVLHVEINYEGMLLESDYTNNVADVPITVRPDDVTSPCPPSIRNGSNRNCGLRREGTFTCTPGARIEVGCSALCGLGECTGDAFLRVCDPARDPGCDTAFALASNDNSYCDMELCGLGGDCCPRAELDCPASGEIVVFTGSYYPTSPHTCDLAVSPL
ncbi:MAG: hypothetical protein H6719_22520 [Sandaracinaceae bacterium]|nr:hypothetical protein [Sandaracinaceae bacterium]